MAVAKNEEIEINDAAVVEVDLSDKPELAKQLEEAAAKPEAEEEEDKQPVTRVRLAEPEKEEAEPDAATVALKEAVAKSEAARKAAEAQSLADRQRAEQATRLANQRGQEVAEAREQAADRELTLLDTGIVSATKEVESLQGELQHAMEAGDFAKTASVQARLAKAAAALDRLEDAKSNFEARKPATTEGAIEVQQNELPPFEKYLSSGFAPEAQAWLRLHPECAPANVGGNAQSNAKMMQGHYAAVAKGIPLNTQEYFTVIEEHTGHRKPVEAEVTEAKPAKVAAAKPAKAAPSAPISREPPAASTGIPQNKRSVTLTPEQQEAAVFSFPKLTKQEAFAQYARNLVELQAEGKIGRTTH